MTGGIDRKTMWAARGLSTLAYTGLVLVAPPVLAQLIWIKVAEVGEKIIGQALGAWAEEIEELVEEVVDLVEQVVA